MSEPRKIPVSDAVVPLRPETVRDRVAQFAVVQKPLSALERIYNQVWLRKLLILVVLALIWEAYGRFLNNDLLFPTFSATARAFFDAILSGVLPARAWASQLHSYVPNTGWGGASFVSDSEVDALIEQSKRTMDPDWEASRGLDLELHRPGSDSLTGGGPEDHEVADQPGDGDRSEHEPGPQNSNSRLPPAEIMCTEAQLSSSEYTRRPACWSAGGCWAG